MHKKRVSSYGDPMVMVWRSYGFDSTLPEKGLGKGGGELSGGLPEPCG